jgi:hypothetical protein
MEPRADETGTDPPDDPTEAVEILNGIPGAWDRAELGRRQAATGQVIPLEDL